MEPILPILQQALPASIDIKALIEETRREVEALASEGWTDFNTHDPGITVLEQLAYAISDLGLRSRLDMADYLSRVEDSYFYTARQILPNAAYTQTDYRCLFIDLFSVWPCLRDAWVRPFPKSNKIKGVYFFLMDIEFDFFKPTQFSKRELVNFRREVLSSSSELALTKRNLCEDWEESVVIDTELIAVRAKKMEIQSEAEPLEVLARIYFILDQFIDPYLQPATFDSLRALDKTAADIFEGPLLQNSFLPEESQGKAKRADKLYTSDFVHLIMQQPEVIGVSKLVLYASDTKYNNCLPLTAPETRKPKFNFNYSDLPILKNGTAVVVNKSDVEERWKALRKAYKAGFVYDNSGDFLPSRGDQLNFATFYSIQNEFPQTYGLRAGEIAPKATPLRKAQAKQLKAYLLFFEQLMVNYCGQLDHLQDLFSMSSDVESTYFFQPLYDVPEVQQVLSAFLAEQSQALDTNPVDWEDFKNRCNTYIKTLEAATEDRSTFLRRRNQFVDHLLARLGEDFSGYTAYSLSQNDGDIPPDLLFDKLDFLQRAPELSSHRATAFDYTHKGELWDTNNVSGYEKRVAALLGIPDYSRRSLTQKFEIEKHIEKYEEIDEVEDFEIRFRIWNAPIINPRTNEKTVTNAEIAKNDYRVLLSSTRRYKIKEGKEAEFLKEEIDKTFHFGQQGKYYHTKATAPVHSEVCKYYFNLLDDSLDEEDPIARRIQYFTSRAEMELAIKELIYFMQGRVYEGMHVIEHVLLRPLGMEGEEELQPITFDVKLSGGSSDQLTLIEDPYSFQLSIFLPGWTPRFRDPEFRNLVEQTLRKELPAHLFAWIYWVELEYDGSEYRIPREFLEFEDAFEDWLRHLDSNKQQNKRDNFIKKINTLVKSSFCNRTNTYVPFELNPV